MLDLFVVGDGGQKCCFWNENWGTTSEPEEMRGSCCSVNGIENLFEVPFYSIKENCCPFLWREESTLYVSIYIKCLTWKFPLTFNKICQIPQSASKLSSWLPLSGCLTSSCLSFPSSASSFSHLLCVSPLKKSPCKFPFLIHEMGYCE